MDIVIEELSPPEVTSPRAERAWQQLEDFAGIMNRTYETAYGEGQLLETSQRVLADWTMPGPTSSRLFIAYERNGTADARALAAARLIVAPADSPSHAYPHVAVDAPHRRLGIGTALATHLEALALRDGRSFLQDWVEHPTSGGTRIAAPTGHGSIAAHDPAARFLLRLGWELGQIERISLLRLPAPDGLLRQHLDDAVAHAGSGYRVLTWQGESDAAHLDDLARLNGDMSLDAPAGELQIDEEAWDAQRVQQMERRVLASGATFFTSAVLHVPSGRLVAQSMLQLDLDDTSRPAQQDNTLVTATHRGHRLGMLVKVANLVQLTRRHPECAGVFTWNAEENAHMLRVNEALGFEAVAAEGGWQKRLTP